MALPFYDIGSKSMARLKDVSQGITQRKSEQRQKERDRLADTRYTKREERQKERDLLADSRYRRSEKLQEKQFELQQTRATEQSKLHDENLTDIVDRRKRLAEKEEGSAYVRELLAGTDDLGEARKIMTGSLKDRSDAYINGAMTVWDNNVDRKNRLITNQMGQTHTAFQMLGNGPGNAETKLNLLKNLMSILNPTNDPNGLNVGNVVFESKLGGDLTGTATRREIIAAPASFPDKLLQNRLNILVEIIKKGFTNEAGEVTDPVGMDKALGAFLDERVGVTFSNTMQTSEEGQKQVTRISIGPPPPRTIDQLLTSHNPAEREQGKEALKTLTRVRGELARQSLEVQKENSHNQLKLNILRLTTGLGLALNKQKQKTGNQFRLADKVRNQQGFTLTPQVRSELSSTINALINSDLVGPSVKPHLEAILKGVPIPDGQAVNDELLRSLEASVKVLFPSLGDKAVKAYNAMAYYEAGIPVDKNTVNRASKDFAEETGVVNLQSQQEMIQSISKLTKVGFGGIDNLDLLNWMKESGSSKEAYDRYVYITNLLATKAENDKENKKENRPGTGLVNWREVTQ